MEAVGCVGGGAEYFALWSDWGGKRSNFLDHSGSDKADSVI